MEGFTRISTLVSQCRFPGLHFEWGTEDGHAFLRVVADADSPYATDSVDPSVTLPWKGRKWRLSRHMVDGEVVQTALTAVLYALEHEARERFTFRGHAVFGPHMDILGLLEVARKGPVVRPGSDLDKDLAKATARVAEWRKDPRTPQG